MASFNGVTTSNPSVAFGGRSTAPRNGVTLDPGGVTTIYYITAEGTIGSTTDPSAVPSTAGIVRRVTT
jgi:hypothetical protein